MTAKDAQLKYYYSRCVNKWLLDDHKFFWSWFIFISVTAATCATWAEDEVFLCGAVWGGAMFYLNNCMTNRINKRIEDAYEWIERLKKYPQ